MKVPRQHILMVQTCSGGLFVRNSALNINGSTVDCGIGK